MTGLDWLTARPIAHRGLHDAAASVIENTPSAAAAALEAGYGIEVDLQPSADGEAMVYHDYTLDRLTEASGAIENFSAAALKRIAFKGTTDRMMTLGDLVDLIGGRTTLVLELKSRFEGKTHLALRTAEVLAARAGPIAVMSFDPVLVSAIRRRAPHLARGIVIQRPGAARSNGSARSAAALQRSFAFLLHTALARPHFIACRLQDIATVPPRVARFLFGWPTLAWTVRSEGERRKAMRHAEQIIFEGFRPAGPERT